MWPVRAVWGLALVAAALALALAAPSAARAQSDDARPWAAGVSPEQQAAALARFQSANQAFAEKDYASAIAQYEEALRAWPHPAIEGNLAVALIQVDRVVDAYGHLEKAFAYGAAPFEPEVWSQLQTVHKLLLGQIAHLELSGPLDGVQVLLDGAALPPGASHTIRAGAHELTARRTGYLTFTERIDAAANAVTSIHLALVPLEAAGTVERRWPPWKPWAVVLAGAGVAAAGTGLELAARNNVDDYERELARTCPDGCTPASLSPAVRGLASRARWEDRVGVPAIAAGATALVLGGVLVWLDQPHRTRVDENGRRISLAPVVGPSSLAVTARLSF
ncbi:MAG TPA: hypothetical protein VHE35_12270 [Kofleriaceae bacterium]|nr:hypothetical protein [Kofleriaceae bacterium]